MARPYWNSRSISRVVAAAVFLATSCLPAGASASLPGDEDGRSEFDQKVEDILLSGEVVSSEEVGEGITHPLRLVIKKGELQVRALFKTVDIATIGPSRNSRFELNFSDKYTYEAAAYRLDRLFGTNVVPQTVIREVNGQRGAVIYWIEDAISVGKAITDHMATRDPVAFQLHYGAMTVLDSLTFNIDRNPTNILLAEDEQGFYAIDSSRAFRLDRKLNPFVTNWSITLPDVVRERLRSVTDDQIRKALAGLVAESQIEAVVARRVLLVKKLVHDGVLPG